MGLLVAKKTSNPDPARGGRKTAPIQVDKDLAKMVAVVASHDGTTQAELISSHLRPFVVMHYERVMKAIAQELKGMGKNSAAGS